MLDIKFIRENSKDVEKAAKRKGMKIDIDRLLKVDQERRSVIHECDELRAAHKKESDKIAKLKPEERKQAIQAVKSNKERLAKLEEKNQVLDQEFQTLLRGIPNLPLKEVPEGASEKENVVVREVGKKKTFSFKPKDHLELGEFLGIIDFKSGAKIAGSGFYYLKNEGALLELALVQYAFDYLRKKGFSLFITPDVAREEFYLGTGYAPRGPEAQTYLIQDTDLGLIATSEVTLGGIHANEVLSEKELPMRYAGYSHCFRQEGGAYGKYSRGLYRVHQFTKVEMFAYTTPEDSAKMHEEFLRIEEEIWKGLEIPFRVVEMCAGDLGAQAARKFDLEAWMPGRGDWGEVTSASNTTDFQARRLNIKYKKGSSQAQFAHTLNGTAIATSRAIIAILENNQTADGRVRVPDVLKPWMNNIEIIG